MRPWAVRPFRFATNTAVRYMGTTMKRPELIIGVLGILGTISGVIFGYVGALRAVEIQLEHQDRTRFQEQRLDAYTTFLERSTALVAMSHHARPLTGTVAEVFTDTINSFNNSFKRIELSGGSEVRKLTRELHASVVAFADGQKTSGDKNAVASFTKKMNELTRAMRVELGMEAESGQKLE